MKKIILILVLIILISSCVRHEPVLKKEKPEIVQITEIESNEEIELELPEHCTDGVYNKGEQGLDCGWSCPNECKFVTKKGHLFRDETWSGNIFVEHSVFVPEGVTLTIEPGTIIKFKHSRPPLCGQEKEIALNIRGTLISVGTPDKMIWFTSDALDPINGDWFGITFQDSKSLENIIKYSIVEFGTQDVNLWNSYALISHSILRYNNWENIYMEFHSNPIIEYNRIYDGGYLGIAMEQINSPVIENNHLSNSKAIFSDYSDPIISNNVFTNMGFSAASEGHIVLSGNTIDKNVQFERGVTSAEITNNNLNGDLINFMEIQTVTLNNNNIKSSVNIEIAENIDARNNYWHNAGDITGNSNILDDSNKLDEPVQGITETIEFDYPDIKNFELGYLPGDQEKERYPFIYPEEDETRKIVEKKLPADMIWTVSYDGEDLYATTDLEVLKIDTETFEIIDRFRTASSWLRGMTSDGTLIWVNGYDEGKIHAYNPETHELVKSFDVSSIEGIAKGGLGYANGFLYILIGSRLYKYTTDGEMINERDINLGGHGLGYHDGYFYTCCGDRVCKFTEKGKLIGSVWAGSEECWDVVWIDDELWTAERTNENWEDEKLYHIQIKNDQLIGDC